ncbi:uncharacterized protein LOC109841405 [Asparagus officinalis]|uniref:uncharacterized protein LOC109841405 n=1 Tax=Asparagus officinalis TaxID=4686 RepID=UPI00098E6437|nr:uncharacterized protein LOC109841405 [Asparagus officinalis]
MLISWIFNSIEKSIQPSIAYEETAKAIWEDLRDRFSIVNAPRIHELKGQIASTRQNGMSVMAYYTQLKSMWDELYNYSKVPNCTCGAAHDFLREHEEEKLHQFLMGLDDAIFGTVRSQILNMEPLPPLNKAYAMISKEERHRSIVRGQEERPEVMAMTVNATAKGRGAGQSWTKQ